MGVASLWRKEIQQSTERADYIDQLAQLEHSLVYKQIHAQQQLTRLEQRIHQIVQSHVDMINHNVISPIPFNNDSRILWPLINVVNSLRKRFVHTCQTEQEFQTMKETIQQYIHQLQTTPDTFLPAPTSYTKEATTDLDLLFLLLEKRLKTIQNLYPLSYGDKHTKQLNNKKRI
jgi:hypothetical protein